MRVLGWLYLGILACIVLLANTEGRWLLRWVNYIPMGDKFAHFFLLGSACLAVNLVLRGRSFMFRGYRLFLGSVVLFAIATTEEFSQIWLINRTFSLFDLLANWLGIISFDRIYAFIDRRQEGAAPTPSSEEQKSPKEQT